MPVAAVVASIVAAASAVAGTTYQYVASESAKSDAKKAQKLAVARQQAQFDLALAEEKRRTDLLAAAAAGPATQAATSTSTKNPVTTARFRPGASTSVPASTMATTTATNPETDPNSQRNQNSKRIDALLADMASVKSALGGVAVQAAQTAQATSAAATSDKTWLYLAIVAGVLLLLFVLGKKVL